MFKLSMAILCFAVVQSMAQVRQDGELLRQLQLYSQADSNRVKVLNMLSHQYQWLDFNRSLQYADEAFRIADSLGFQEGIATASFRRAHCYWALGNSDRSIEQALVALRISEHNSFTSVLGETCRILAMSYRDQQELPKAISYIRQAEHLALKEHNWDLLARVYNLAGVIDYTRGMSDSAMIYYDKSLAVSEAHPGITRFHISQVLSNKGEVYLEGDPDLAMEYFQRALLSARETRNKSAEAGIVADIGRAYLLKKNFSAADHYLRESLLLSRALGLKRVSRHVYYALADLKLQEGKPAEAFNHMRAYYEVRDSLLSASKTRQIVELESRFEKEKQEQRITILEQRQRIERIWKNVLIVGSLLLAAALLIIYRLQKLRSVKAKKLLETEQALNAKLKETDLLKSRFFANISHEFRTPLSLILGPIESQLNSAEWATSQKNDLARIKRNANRLLDLVNQLLDLSKLEAGKMELNIQAGDMATFLHTMTDPFEAMAARKQITFIRSIDVSSDHIGYDADKVEKIITNILFNAFKFTPDAGQVTLSIRSSAQAARILITVADTGPGIPKEELDNIFSPFYQLKGDREDGQPGTGLGLSLVHELVRLYGGTINVSSEVDQGTCITVSLPVMPAPPGRQEPLERRPPGIQALTTSNGPQQEDVKTEHRPEADTILVIEDNAELRNFIASGFAGRVNVLTASGGDEGLVLAAQHVPDVVISDVMMPGMDGLALTRRLKSDEHTSHIPVILLTARADAESRIEGLKEGADDYLTKPFSMEELSLRIANLMEQQKRIAQKLRMQLTDRHYEVPRPNIPSLDEKFITNVRAVIEKNIGNVHFGVEMLATEINLSRAQLFRKLKALLDTSPSELINDLRLQRAAEMIRAKSDNVAQIGYAVGFNEQSYFAKRFRKKFGKSPTEYAQ